jgi:hypothetical protein
MLVKTGDKDVDQRLQQTLQQREWQCHSLTTSIKALSRNKPSFIIVVAGACGGERS